jgi:hypothetical protein
MHVKECVNMYVSPFPNAHMDRSFPVVNEFYEGCPSNATIVFLIHSLFY